MTVVYEGEYLELKVKPNDKCHWLRVQHELSMMDGEEVELPIQSAAVRYDLDNKRMRVEVPNENNPFA